MILTEPADSLGTGILTDRNTTFFGGQNFHIHFRIKRFGAGPVSYNHLQSSVLILYKLPHEYLQYGSVLRYKAQMVCKKEI